MLNDCFSGHKFKEALLSQLTPAFAGLPFFDHPRFSNQDETALA
jgi:hypothetical protein